MEKRWGAWRDDLKYEWIQNWRGITIALVVVVAAALFLSEDLNAAVLSALVTIVMVVVFVGSRVAVRLYNDLKQHSSNDHVERIRRSVAASEKARASALGQRRAKDVADARAWIALASTAIPAIDAALNSLSSLDKAVREELLPFSYPILTRVRLDGITDPVEAAYRSFQQVAPSPLDSPDRPVIGEPALDDFQVRTRSLLGNPLPELDLIAARMTKLQLYRKARHRGASVDQDLSERRSGIERDMLRGARLLQEYTDGVR